MEEVAAVRRAALDAVDDVEPARLRERIRGRIDDGSMAPGVLALLSARAVYDRSSDPPADSFPTDSVAERGAGVQLIYEGLRLTRSISQDPPWERGRPAALDDADDAVAGSGGSGRSNDELTDGGDVALSDADVGESDVPVATDADLAAADMAILVADVLVARGFHLLARTEAAADAVASVRSFGRDQTTRRTTGDESFDADLEADVFELAVVAGTTAVGGEAPDSLREYVTELARDDGSPAADGALSVADGLFSETTVETISAHLADDSGDGVATSADP